MNEHLLEHTVEQDLLCSLRELLKRYALMQQPVTLASGGSSSIYIDCRQVYFRGEAQFLLGELFFKKMLEIEALHKPFLACGGMAMGSIPLTIALTTAAFRRGRPLPGCAVRKESKQHGTQSQIEGSSSLLKGSEVLVVEDVVTTASSAIKAIEALRSAGSCVDTLLCIVDRGQGGRENLAKIDVSLHSLFTLKDLEGLYVDSHD